MSASRVDYTGDGTNSLFSVPFEYLDPTHIAVLVNESAVPFAFDGAFRVRLATPPASGTVVTVRRTTPSATPVVDFVDGSTLTESDLDASTRQLLFLAQEARDLASSALSVIGGGAFDARGRPILNVGEPQGPTSAATVAWTLKQLAEAVEGVASKTTFVFVEKEPTEDGRQYHKHEQTAPAAEWVVTHNLNTFPTATVFDAQGEYVLAGWKYDGPDKLRLVFAEPLTGVAYIR